MRTSALLLVLGVAACASTEPTAKPPSPEPTAAADAAPAKSRPKKAHRRRAAKKPATAAVAPAPTVTPAPQPSRPKDFGVPEYVRDFLENPPSSMPAADAAVLRSYLELSNERRGVQSAAGERLTILTAKSKYAAGEEIRVIHVYDAARPGKTVYVCGPKQVAGETIDGALVTPEKAEQAPYDGPVMQSPRIDTGYEVTKYRLAPGRHVIRWRSTPSPFGEQGTALVSNELVVDVE